jgi:large subunit ribosomal protein L28
MAKCELTGKSYLNGHKVSHSNRKAPKRSRPNIQTKRVFDVETGRMVRIKVSTRALRTLNKRTIRQVKGG